VEETNELASGAPEVDAKLRARGSVGSGSNKGSLRACTSNDWHRRRLQPETEFE
jgi:hypothetical protein